MLPIRSRTAKLLTNFFGGDYYRLYDTDTEGAVPKGEEFDGNFLYGIEKPQWNDYIESELGKEYLYARYIAVESARIVVNKELDYANNSDGLSDNLFNEGLDLQEYLKETERPSNERLMLYMEPIVEDLSERIYMLGLEQYGWDQDSVTNALIKNIDDRQLRAMLQIKQEEKRVQKFIDKELHNIRWLEESGGEITEDNIDDVINDLRPAFEESDFYPKDEEDDPYYPWYDPFSDMYVEPYLKSKIFDVNKEVDQAMSGMTIEETEEFLGLHDEGKPRDYMHLVRECVAKEYKEFVDYEMKRTPEQLIHEDNYKIRFFNELSAFIEEDAAEQITDRDFEALYTEAPHILDSLYDYYLDSEYVSINNYDDTMDLIEWYNDRYHEELVKDRNDYEGYRELPDRIQFFGYSNQNAFYVVPEMLTVEILSEFQTKSSHYVVAAKSCQMTEEELKENNVTFLEIGKDIQEQDIVHRDAMFCLTEAYEKKTSEKLNGMAIRTMVECKEAIEKGISDNFDGMHLEKGFEDAIIERFGIETVKQVLATTVTEKEYDGRFSPDNKAWAKEIELVDVGDNRNRAVVDSHPAVLDGFINRIRAKEQEQEKGVEKMAEETAKREWIKVNVSDEALISKYEKHSFMRMPATSKYDGYTYNIFNDRITKGIMTTDIQSDSRETSLVIRMPEDEEILLKNGDGEEVVLTAKEFKEIVHETASKEYERRTRVSKKGNEWTSIIVPREALLGVYEKSSLFTTPNGKMGDCSFYVPNTFVDENKENEEGNIRIRVPNDFEFAVKHRETGSQEKLTAAEMKELFKDTKTADFARDGYSSQIDQDETKDNDGWKYVSINAGAKIVEYEKATLFRMPKGEYEDYCFYIPNELLRENQEKGTYRVSLPEDFTVHLKNNRAELDSDKERAITADEFIAQVKGKGAEEYSSEVRTKSRENTAFAKVEKQLIANVPDEMKQQDKWVVVRTKVDDTDGKLKKFLIDCHTGKFARSDDPATWSSFDEARKYASENGGVALAYALDGKDGICCIDVDHCVDDNGNVSEVGKTILAYKDKTLCEKSVSGKGVHLFGKTNGYDVRVWSKNGDMEFYQDSHFITMTGDDVISKELMNIDASPLKDVISENFSTRLHYSQGVGIEGLSRMSDRDVIEKASKSKNGQTFEALYKGEDLQNNHSNSDMKFMNMLAFWCNGDKEQMDRIFRTSGLYRPEKSDSYVECTIMKAIRDVGGRFQSQTQEVTSLGQKSFKAGSTGNSK